MQHGAATDEVFQQSFTFERRLPAPGRQARPRRRARRRRGRQVPVRGRRTCRSTGSRTARCTTGERRLPTVHPMWLPDEAFRALGSRRVLVAVGPDDGPVADTVVAEVAAATERFGGTLVTTPATSRRRSRVRRGARDRRERRAGGDGVGHACRRLRASPATDRPVPAGRAGRRRGPARPGERRAQPRHVRPRAAPAAGRSSWQPTRPACSTGCTRWSVAGRRPSPDRTTSSGTCPSTRSACSTTGTTSTCTR